MTTSYPPVICYIAMASYGNSPKLNSRFTHKHREVMFHFAMLVITRGYNPLDLPSGANHLICPTQVCTDSLPKKRRSWENRGTCSWPCSVWSTPHPSRTPVASLAAQLATFGRAHSSPSQAGEAGRPPRGDSQAAWAGHQGWPEKHGEIHHEKRTISL